MHKAASSTVQNILYRFGSHRNLSFVLPYNTHYISKYPSKSYNALLGSPDYKTGKYDILCNHVVFNHTKFKHLMYDDTIYIAIVREPLDQFISAAYYSKYVYPIKYLKKLNETTFIQDLINDPEKFEDLEKTQTFNHMAWDFGFVMNSIGEVLELSDDAITFFISRLKNTFDLVMVVEYFDESLVMMKRLLNWSLKDILYVKLNQFESKKIHPSSKANVSNVDKAIFRRRNRLDYAIYDTFRDIFLQKMSKEMYFKAEVKKFKTISNDVHAFCLEPIQMPSKRQITFSASKWNTAFSVDEQDCKLMVKKELPFWKYLLRKHKSILSHRK